MKFAVTICFFLLLLTVNVAGSTLPKARLTLQEAEADDAAQVALWTGRFKTDKLLKEFLEGALHSLTNQHPKAAKAKSIRQVAESFITAMEKFNSGNETELRSLGGIKAFKDKLSIWLKDENQAIRGFSATLLGLIGDKAYATQISQLLAKRKYSKADFPIYERGQAAIALGFLGAKEFAPQLYKLMHSRNDYDKVGAIVGLGYLKTKEYAQEITALLEDKNAEVRQAAFVALEKMDEPN